MLSDGTVFGIGEGPGFAVSQIRKIISSGNGLAEDRSGDRFVVNADIDPVDGMVISQFQGSAALYLTLPDHPAILVPHGDNGFSAGIPAGGERRMGFQFHGCILLSLFVQKRLGDPDFAIFAGIEFGLGGGTGGQYKRGRRDQDHDDQKYGPKCFFHSEQLLLCLIFRTGRSWTGLIPVLYKAKDAELAGKVSSAGNGGGFLLKMGYSISM